MPQQEADFLEGGPPGQIVNVVPAVGKHALFAIQVADGRRGRDDVFEAGLRLFCGGHSGILAAIGGVETLVEIGDVRFDLWKRRIGLRVDQSDNRAIDAELADARNQFEHAKANGNRLGHEVPDRSEPVDHERHDESEADAVTQSRSLSLVPSRIRESEGQAADKLCAKTSRYEPPDVVRSPKRPGIRVIEA